MRYLSLFTHSKPNAAPTQHEMNTMGKLIEEGMKEGWLIVTEGIAGPSPGTRVSSSDGKISVVDGPFAEAKEVIGGYAILRANSKEEVIALCKRFLTTAGGGTCEFHQLYQQ